MTDEREKSSRGVSVARPTARDVPYVRSESLSEAAPQAQRPAQLPRDPSYEAELAQVELAVLRDPDPRLDPSTKQGGVRAHQLIPGPPESITPESPGAGPRRPAAPGQSPEPPSSAARAVASGTLLSIGAVDPRGKTERTLETPRMFFSPQQGGAEAYFKPGKIPAVTVHQTLETETVKLADSIDPRRAITIPRLDRVALAQLADESPSAAPMMLAGPGSDADSLAPAAERWDSRGLEADPSSLPSNYDGQIHASLSAFRDGAEQAFSLDDAPTRPEPIAAAAARRLSDLPELELAGPDPSTVPTHRDLPAHRIEASEPPPAPHSVAARRAELAVDEPESEGPHPTTASIASEEPERRPLWINYVAFLVALLVAIVVGLFLTQEPKSSGDAADRARLPQSDAARLAAPSAPVLVAPALPPAHDAEPAAPAVAEKPTKPPATAATVMTPAKKAAAPLAPAPAPASASDASRKPAPKSARETIF
jgi:hypothetical protein